MKLLAGLGNPGIKYKNTRHNIGFMVLEKLALNKSVQFRQNKKIWGQIAEIRNDAQLQRILMPNTYMNESGRSIKATLEWFGIEINQLLVLVDDMDLPLGKLRFRSKGSSGGHNGLKSAIEHLGTTDFCRLRIGIGPPTDIQAERKLKTNSHVLGRFTQQELSMVDKTIDQVIKGLELIHQSDLTKASTYINSYKPESL